MATVRVNEFTPLLVPDDRPPHLRRRRNVWPYIVASAFGAGLLLSFVHDAPNDATLDASVALDEASPSDDAAFLQSLESFKDPSVDPCEDFYQYACGGWLATHDIPTDSPSIDASFYVVSEQNEQTIQHIFHQKPPQIGELYASCLNDQDVDATAVAFVAQLTDRIHATDSTLQLMELAGELDQSLGISTFFSVFVGADPKDPSTNVLQLEQGGLTLPSREYYLEQTKVDKYAAMFVEYVTKLFAVGELDKHNVSAYAEAVLEMETALAKVSLPNAALRNPWTTSTAYPYAEIAQRYPFVMAYLNGIYSKEPFPMLHAIIATPGFFDAQNELLKDDALLPQLKNYMSFHLIDSFGAILGEYFRRASHEFHGPIQGAGAILPRDQFCVRLTTAFLGEQLGVYYMQELFGPDAKAAAQALVAEIEESLKALLTTEAWLDKITYDAAVAKLNMVKNYIGGPNVVPPLPFTLQANAFFDNVRSLMELSATETIQAIEKPVDPQAWDMFPSTVNAYYDPSANKMVFPAAILQPPFYSADHFPAAANFARIGMVMGHELSHGFDDQGRNYDGTGALRSWWTPAVSEEFAEKTQCLAAQYSSFPIVSIEDGHVLGTINGNLTLGENIADNGGIHLAYEAFHLWRSTYSPTGPAPGTKVPPQPEPTRPVETPTEVPNEDIPVATPPPVIPFPDEPVPEPTEIGPGEEIPVVTIPPPVLPVPDAETPAPAETEPSGEIPVATPMPPPVVPEPQPADVGPGEEIPDQTPEPAETEPDTGIPTPPPTVTEPAPVETLPPPQTEPASEIPVETPPMPTEPVETKPTKDKHAEKHEEDNGHKKHHGHESGSVPDGDDEGTEKHEKKHSKDEGVNRKSDKTEERHHHVEGENESDRHKHRHDESEGKHERGEEHGDKHERHDHRSHHEEEKDGEDEDNGHHKHDKYRYEHHERGEGHGDKHERYEHRNHREQENDGDDEDNGHNKHDKYRYGHHGRDEHKDDEDEYGRHGHHHRDSEEERDERREERREERKERREERQEERERHHRHKHYDRDWESKRDGCDGGCGRHGWIRTEQTYPFSSGNAKIHSMVATLARSFVQPNDPVADDRLFFTAFAQNWCEKRSPAYAELLRMIDPHAPGKWRVNGPLMNYDKFAEAFNCPVGSPMNPEKKCVIW